MDVLPMFPLGTALLPGRPLPLQIFEPRYLAMLRDIAAGEGRFGVVLIERGFEVGGGDHRFSVGTVAAVEQARPTPDGRVLLLARGQERFEVVRWLPDDPYPRAEVRLLPELRWSREHAEILADDAVTRSWQLAGIAPVGALDQLTLLRSSSVDELLETTARLTTEAVDLLAMQLPDDPA